MTAPIRIAVIGAGMSGLAALRALTRAGLDVTGYEAGSAIGGMWRYNNDSGLSAAYASLETNTSRRRMQYPSLPMPTPVPEFPHHSDMLAYLEAYARTNDLARHVHFGCPVEKVQPAELGWEVTAGHAPPARFDWVVAASGHYWDPAIPELTGEFHGTSMHARDYRTADAFAGQRVVVVGGAQSALDIVAEIAAVAERTILACSHVHHLLPRRVLGRPFDDFDTAAALYLPLPVARLLARSMMTLGRATPARGRLPPPVHPMFETRWPAVVAPAAEAAIASAAFESRPHLAALAGDGVVFGDGSRERVDAIVFATGYRISFPFLPEPLGRGNGWEFPLYRRILSPHASGLAFIGVLEPGPGLFEIVERQAEWLAEVASGRLTVPHRAARWQAIDAGGERGSRRQFAATGRHTILVNRHAYLRLLARDLNHPARR
ncbi:MAG TPA: NAD(P)-binding domain-containing protein [Mycobacteriales bacterium]|nr:NAD(P)-binding domain-containing protein [Mycobacteriales bacterium]